MWNTGRMQDLNSLWWFLASDDQDLISNKDELFKFMILQFGF